MRRLAAVTVVFLCGVIVCAQQGGTSPEATPASARPDSRIRVSEGVLDGLVVKRVLPIGPFGQDKSGQKGIVKIAVLVDYDGTIKKTSVVSGDPVLGEIATHAIRQWQFKPYTINGEPVQVESRVIMKFSRKKAELLVTNR